MSAVRAPGRPGARGGGGPSRHVGVDSGGSQTRVCQLGGAQEVWWRGLPSLNPAAGDDGAEPWGLLCERLASHMAWPSGVCIGSAGVWRGSLVEQAEIMRAAATAAGLTGEFALTNDVVPLLFAPPLGGVGLVAAVGTGTAFLGRTMRGRVGTASGYEYVISDEGGAFDLGLRGLRAAAKAYDGRGAQTGLLKAATRWAAADVPAIGRRLALASRRKQLIAEFAIDVCRLAGEGDLVALSVVAACVSEAVDGVGAVVAQLPELSRRMLVLTGGVVYGCSLFRDRLLESLSDRWPTIQIVCVPDAARAAAALAAMDTAWKVSVGIAQRFPYSSLSLSAPRSRPRIDS